jgi:hypothetical protein
MNEFEYLLQSKQFYIVIFLVFKTPKINYRLIEIKVSDIELNYRLILHS